MKANPRVLVIGPTLIDIYFVGQSTRLDQTAPVPVIDVATQLIGAGGAANVAISLARLGANTDLLTVLGVGPEQAQLGRALAEQNLQLKACIVTSYKHPTKTRVFVQENDRLISRVDMNTVELKVEDHVCDTFARTVSGNTYDVILIADYGNAVVTESVLRVVLEYAQQQNIRVIATPSVERMQLYKNCDSLIVTAAQVCAYTRCVNQVQAANMVYNELKPSTLFLELNGRIVVYDGTVRPVQYPALPARTDNSCGRRDAITAAVAYATGCGTNAETVAKYAAAASSASSDHFGVSAIGLHDVFNKLLHYTGAAGKITNYDTLIRIRQSVKASKLKFGAVIGTFDKLNGTDIGAISKARRDCDFLAVFVRHHVLTEDACQLRLNMLANLQHVDAVFLMQQDDATLSALKPDVVDAVEDVDKSNS